MELSIIARLRAVVPEIDPHSEEGVAPEDREAVRRVRAAVTAAGRQLRERHPILRHQDRIGLAIQLSSAAAMAGAWAGYAYAVLPAWLTVIVVAFACSISHEVEHDLIHRLYYPRSPRMRHFMMAIGWLMRPSTVNPWIRVRLHLDHHRFSGTEADLEERAITNGEPWGIRRFLMTGDGLLAVVLRLPLRKPRIALRLWLMSTFAYFPLGWVYHSLWVIWLLGHGQAVLSSAFGVDVALPEFVGTALPAVDFLVVTWLLPNLLRTFSLHLISSNVHYYGDVKAGDVLRQTQVIDHWWFLPFQLFCFNFGGTHAIHHYWVPETFYVRQLTVRQAHAAMRENGVRFNDFGTFRRANRYEDASEASTSSLAAQPAS